MYIDPKDRDAIGTMVRQTTSPSNLAQILYTLAEMHEQKEFPFTNSDMPSFLRGLGDAVLEFEVEPEGEFVEIVDKGQWHVFAQIVNMALELE